MKGRKGKATGGENEADEDLKSKPEPRTNAKEIDGEAEEKKRGGRAKKARGGHAEGFGPEDQKTAMKVGGAAAKHHAGRMPRKNGGRTGSDGNPFTTANKGKPPTGRHDGGPERTLEGMNSGRR